MPDYNYTITVPADTSKDDPIKTELKLTKGVIAGGQIYFPFGCAGMVHVTINDNKGQLYPANKDDTFHGEGYAVPLVGRHELDSAPYKLYAHAWSPDTTYQHEPQLTIAILTEEQVAPLTMLGDLVKIFKRMLGIR